jgi:hypothetical protein
MASTTTTIPASRLAKNLTMTVRITGLRRLRCRFWLGGLLVSLAARVMGCGIEVIKE